MAKEKNEQGELKKLIEGLYKIIQTTSASSKEQVRINRELLKTMSLIQAGFTSNAQDAKDLIAQVRDEGFSITDEFVTKWAKERKIAKDDLDDIIKKFRTLEQVEDDVIENSRDYIDLLETQYDLLDDEVDLTKKLLRNYDDILKVVKQSKNEAAKLGGGIVDMERVLKVVSNKIDLSAMFQDAHSSLSEVENLIGKVKSDVDGMLSNVSGQFFNVDLHFNPLSGDLDQEIQKVLKNVEIEKNLRLENLRNFFNENKKLQTQLTRQIAGERLNLGITLDLDTGDIKTATGIIKRGTDEFEALTNKLDEFSKNNNLVQTLGPAFNEIIDLTSLSLNRTEEQQRRLHELIAPLGSAAKLIIEENDQYQSILLKQKHLIEAERLKFDLISKSLNQLQSAESVVMRIGSGFDYINALLPAGIGEFLGLSKVSQQLIDSHKKGITEFSSALGDGATQAQAMQKYFQAFKPAISLALNPMTILVTSAILLFKFVEGITEKYKEMASEMKISLGQAKDLLEVQLDTLTSQKNQFATLKDIQEIQRTMIGSSGKMFDLASKDSKEMALNLVEVGKYFGYGNEQAVELHKTFTRLGADNKLSLQLQRNLGSMSEMAGLSPQIVAQDLIDSADEVSTYFAGMPDKAAKAAIEVRRMGLSLKQAGSIAQRMLELDSFMTDMYELRAMTGPNGIDFSRAFDKGLLGDIEGMTKEIMDQIGSTAEFNKMDYLTRTKIAKTLGMSADELAKSVTLNEKMQGLSAENQKYLQGNLDRMGDISALSQEDIRNKLQQLQSTDRLAIAWDKIKGVLVKSLLPLVEAFADGIDAISPLIDILIFGLKGVGSIIKLIGPLLQIILKPLSMGASLLEKMTSNADEFGSSLGSVGKIGAELIKISTGILTIWASWKALKIFGVVNKDMGQFIKGIPILGSVFGKVFGQNKEIAQQSNDEIIAKTNETVSTVSSNVSKATKEVAKNIEKTTQEVSKSTSKMSKDVSVSIEQTQQTIKKGGKLSFITSDTAKKTFGTIGEIASKTFAIMAIRSATSFIGMKKEGTEAASEMSSEMSGIMDLAFMGVGTMLTGYLQEGIEKVFSKKIEKSIEGKLENPIKNLSKKFGDIEKPATDSFDKIENKGKGTFSKIIDFAKKMLPGSTTSITGTFDNLADHGKKITQPMEMVSDVVEKVKKNKSEELIQSTTKTQTIEDVSKPIKNVNSKTTSGFTNFKNILKSVWDGIKTVLIDIVKFVSSSMKELSSGIGTSIKNILKGIGDGLSSFKTSAIKGAATMVIVSGSLWILSEAVKNFSTVKWEDLGKAGASLAGLAAISFLLGSASPQMILGAASIGLLSLSLIPLTYALNEFNKIEWSSLGKAGVALVGLGVAGAVFGSLLPLMLLGSVGIAALGASLIPFAAALTLATPGLETFGKVIDTTFNGLDKIINSTASGISNILGSLMQVDIRKLIAIGPALAGIGAGFMALNVGGGLLGKIFGGDVVKDLEKLGKLSEPLHLVQNALQGLNDILIVLSETMSNLTLENIKELDKLSEIGIDSEVKQKIKPIVDNYQRVEQDSTKVKISPIQTPVAQVQRPNKGSVAQNNRINDKQIQQTQQILQQGNVQNIDNYEGDTFNENKNMELLMMKMVGLLEVIAKKEFTAELDGYAMNKSIKKYNN